MLKRIRLIDFKSFVDEQVELAPLTVLVGANASGKSNFLDALWLLRGLGRGLPLEVVLDGEEPAGGNGDRWPGVRGGAAEASRAGTSAFEIKTEWTDPREPIETTHRIRCQTAPRPERLEETNALVGENFKSIQLLGPRPERMRGYGQLKRRHLGSEGANFSGALYHLCKDPDERRNLVDWLAELLAPEIVDVDFIKVEELGDVMAVFVEKDGTRVSARSLSDGTLRFLGLLLTLRTAEPGSVLLVEEIDSGLHPARIRVLVELLQTIIEERRLQIIATTHAPTVLEALDENTLADSIVFGRTPEHTGTLMRRLGDLPHFREALERKGIAELFTTGWLEMAL